MDNPRNMWHNPQNLNLSKNMIYNYSLGPYNYTIHGYSQKDPLDTSNKFEQALINLKEGLADFNQENKDIDRNKSFNYNNIPMKKISFSSIKKDYQRVRTPKRDFSLLKNNFNFLNSSNILSKSAIGNSYVHSPHENINKPPSIYQPSMATTRRSSKTGIFNDIKNLEIVYNTNINEDSKPKELVMLNNILKKQNKEIRIKSGEMRHKINVLLNNLRISRMDNQKLNNEKKELLMKISYLENELDMNKNMSSNAIELKNNTIDQLKNDIVANDLLNTLYTTPQSDLIYKNTIIPIQLVLNHISLNVSQFFPHLLFFPEFFLNELLHLSY